MMRPRVTMRVVRSIVAANAGLLVFFALLYWVIGMDKHFGTTGAGLEDATYFAVVAHTSVGFGDIAPKTRLARLLVSLHVLAVWAVTLVLAVDGLTCVR